jgi:polar amino acid transport system permease protein
MLSTILFFILEGAAVTVAVALVALPMGLVLGLALALVHTYGGKPFSWLVTTYSTVLRGAPPILLLFILYFVVSKTINLSAFWAGSISLGIISSAYQLEILRGALLCVGSGQMVAARAMGMSRFKAIRHIILPQALRLAIPAWSNEAAIVIKDSSLVYALGVQEILRRAELLRASTQQSLLLYSIAALIYFILVFLTNRGLDWVQRKTRIPGMS